MSTLPASMHLGTVQTSLLISKLTRHAYNVPFAHSCIYTYMGCHHHSFRQQTNTPLNYYQQLRKQSTQRRLPTDTDDRVDGMFAGADTTASLYSSLFTQMDRGFTNATTTATTGLFIIQLVSNMG